MLKRLALAACLIAVAATAQEIPPPSQPPEPSTGIPSQPAQPQAATSDGVSSPNQRGTEDAPFIIQIVPSPQTQAERSGNGTQAKQESTTEDPRIYYTGLLALFTFLLFIVGSAQAGLFYWQLRLMRVGIKDAADAANAALANAKAAQASADTMRNAERAYVKISHYPPGVTWDEKNAAAFSVTIRVKNFGRTPARVTGVLLKHEVLASLPAVPNYETGVERSSAFLVVNDEFNRIDGFALNPAQRKDFDSGAGRLFLYGYVDYVDKFGDRHRGSYARRYDPTQMRRDNNRNCSRSHS